MVGGGVLQEGPSQGLASHKQSPGAQSGRWPVVGAGEE